MFERVKIGQDSSESQDKSQGETEKAFGSLRSKVSGRSGDVAVIGSSIQINGDLRGDEDLRIEGNVSGTVNLRNSALTIGKNGKVKADVYAKSIAVDGDTTGDLYATDCVSVHVNARVQGNIVAPRVSIEEGAHFKGSIEMDPAAVEKALGETRAAKVETPVSRDKSGSSAPGAKKNPSDIDKAATPPAKSA